MDEKNKVVTICDHLRSLKFSPQPPHVFAEQGVAMLSSVLKSERAVQVNIRIMRTFTKLRQFILTHKELQRKIELMEKKYDYPLRAIFEAIRKLSAQDEQPKRKIGF